MELTSVDPVATYQNRVNQLEAEFLNHQMLQAEIRRNPEVTGDDEKEALANSEQAVTVIENAHACALELLDQAKREAEAKITKEKPTE